MIIIPGCSENETPEQNKRRCGLLKAEPNTGTDGCVWHFTIISFFFDSGRRLFTKVWTGMFAWMHFVGPRTVEVVLQKKLMTSPKLTRRLRLVWMCLKNFGKLQQGSGLTVTSRSHPPSQWTSFFVCVSCAINKQQLDRRFCGWEEREWEQQTEKRRGVIFTRSQREEGTGPLGSLWFALFSLFSFFPPLPPCLSARCSHLLSPAASRAPPWVR